MTARQHHYRVHLVWVSAAGSDPESFRRHDRTYRIGAAGKPDIVGSCDALFRGDAHCWNPEDLLMASLSACHQLWYLGLCAEAGIVVMAYEDDAEGTMLEESPGGAGQFTGAVLRPQVTVAPGSDVRAAEALHRVAHEHCFVARSVNFPVTVAPVVTVAASA